ncbi:MAG: hypothetical protein OXE83_15025 [Gammaproteobacteria bacterium]|nr:hypothetical protein [Gammaproteobacteria bacterium]
MAYVDGISSKGMIGGAMLVSIAVAAVLATTYALRVLRRKRSQHGSSTLQSPKQQEARKEAVTKADFKEAAMMLGGVGFGFLIGSALFDEVYALIACSVAGGAAGPAIAKWLDRNMGE